MASIFKKLSAFLSPPTPDKTEAGFEIPFGLSPPEWERLKALVDDDDYDLFLKTLDTLCNLQAEKILGSSTTENVHFHRGFVMGLRQAASIIHEARNAEETYLIDERNRNRPRDSGRDELALFGTPAWRPKRKHAS